jgi:hypothetical protein
MKKRQGCKGYVIEARSCELKDGGFSAELCVIIRRLRLHRYNLLLVF